MQDAENQEVPTSESPAEATTEQPTGVQEASEAPSEEALQAEPTQDEQPSADAESAVPVGDPMDLRPPVGATTSKTAPVPSAAAQPGVLGPANPVTSGNAVSRPASQIGAAKKRQKALRDASVSNG